MKQRLNQPAAAAAHDNATPYAYLQTLGDLLKMRVATPPSAEQRLAGVRFGQYIQSARHFHGLSQESLAAALGIAPAEVYGLETGLLPIPYITEALLPALAHILDEDPAFLQQLLRTTPKRRRWSLAGLHLPGWEGLLTALSLAFRGNALMLLSRTWVSYTDTCLQCDRAPDLINRLQTSRLLLYATTSMVVFALVAFVGLGRSPSQPRSLAKVAEGPGSALSTGNGVAYSAMPALLSTEPPFSGTLGDPIAMPPLTKPSQRESYQIIYASSQPSYSSGQAAYIAVNDALFAAIILHGQPTPTQPDHCNTSTGGRFVLCPI